MSEKDPAHDRTARVKRHDRFRTEKVECAAHERALALVRRLARIGARNQMPMQFEPTDQRIAFAKFQFIRFRQTTKTGAKPVFVAFAGEREKSNATDASGIGCSFHDCSDERFNVVQPAKDSRKSQ